ncbi:SdrD B-like domain-containing protein [Marinobacter sp. ANT_B65]|uniref:DUF7933 domain-containing protein n=1 Tax=Marinobacter sp. ANT_B65 TaxID=2039467 RepID=UPI000BBE406C|nr:SdrD B-like domain-containing protein [Marinobacter sp. ANT_B65]PCM43531.1 hypothetical protein CPA50_14215 [Marinobacter sp. ANT_B65]
MFHPEVTRRMVRLFVNLSLVCSMLLPALVHANIGVSKTQAPGYAGTKYVGDIDAFRIRLTNNDDTAVVTSVSFTDTMPPGFQVAGGAVVSAVCADGTGAAAGFSGTVTAPLGSNTFGLTGGVIPPRNGGSEAGFCELVVEVTSTVAGSGTNELPVNSVTGIRAGTPVSNADPAVQSLNFEGLSSPGISKSFGASEIVKADEPTRLTITIANNASQPLPLNGVGDSPAFAIRDRLGDSGLRVAPDPDVQISCGGTPPSFSPSAGDLTITAVGGEIAAESACELSVMVVADGVTNAYSTSVVNTIDRNTDFANKRGLIPSSNATATLSATAPLRVSKRFTPATISAGQEAILEIRLTNASPLTGMQLGAFADDIDGPGDIGLEITSAPTVSCSGGSSLSGLTGLGSQTLEFTSGSLQPDSSCLIRVPYTATLDVAGTAQAFTNTIPEGGITVTSPAGVVSQQAVASVTVADRFRVEKSRSPAVVAPGNPVRFDVRVRNFRIQPETVTVTDRLPTGMQLLGAAESYPDPALSGAGCSTLVVGGSEEEPTFTFDMPAGVDGTPSACTVRFWAMAPEGASAGVTITNSIAGGDVCSGGICSDITDSASYTVSSSTLAVEKEFDESSRPEGAPATMTLTLLNWSAQPLTDVSLTDNLPVGTNGTQMRVASPNNASTTCGGVVSALPGSDQVVLSGATVPARADLGIGSAGRCTLTVNVSGAAGSYVNTLPQGAATGTEILSDGVTRAVESPGPVSRSIDFVSALSGSKSFLPDVIQPGGSSTVRIRFTNSQPGVLENVSLTDNLPAGMLVADPANAYSTCAGSPIVSAQPGANAVSLSGAQVATGNCDLLFDVTATGGSNWVNTIAPGELTAAGGVQNVSSFGATLRNASGGGLSVSLNHSSPSLSAPGAATQLIITLFNNGSLDLTNLNLAGYFTDTGLASGTLTGELIASSPNASTTCTDGVVTATPGEAELNLTGASLETGQTCTVIVDVTMNTTGTVTATIPAGSIVSAQGITNDDPALSSLQTSAGLGVVKDFDPQVVTPGEHSRLRITLYNPTSQVVRNLEFVDDFPGGLTVASPPNAVSTCQGTLNNSADQFSVTGGQIPAGTATGPASCYLEIDVVAAAQGDYDNVIPAGDVTGQVGGTPVSNNDPAQGTLRARSALVVHKAISNFTLDSGDPSGFSTGTAQGSASSPYRLSIVVENQNDIALNGLAFTDNLPDGLVIAQTPDAATTCSGSVNVVPSGQTVRLTGGVISANASCTVSVDVLSNVAGTYTNTLPTGAVRTTEGVTNSETTQARIVISSPPTVAKQFEPAVIAQNGISRLTVYVNNPNDSAMTLTSALVDTLPVSPGDVIVAAAPDIGGTCPSAAVTAGAGTGSVTLASGTVVPAGGCTIELDVTASASGEHTNIIEAGALETDLGSNAQPAYASLAVSTLGYVSGRVYLDNNLTDGQAYVPGVDDPLAGIAIELRSGSDCTGALVSGIPTLQNPAQTSASGSYVFSGLPAGTYSVCQNGQPTGSLNANPVAGSINMLNGSTGTEGVASNPASGSPSSQIAGIQLDANGAGEVSGSVGNLFPEVTPSRLGGSVYIDLNNDGVRQGNETGLPGVVVTLSGTDWQGQAVSRTTTTDSNGNYVFDDLPPGEYTVTEPDQPAGTANGITSAGSTGGTPSTVDVLPSNIQNIALAPDTSLDGLDFGELATGRSIFGRVFYDRDNNGVFDGNDAGIGGERVVLSGVDISGNAVSVTRVTNDDGTYAFTDLPPGVYEVSQPTQPSGYRNGETLVGSAGGVATLVEVVPSTISQIDLSVTRISVGNDFAELAKPASPRGTISGRVFHDQDANDLYDGDDIGLGGQLVVLEGTDFNGNAVSVNVLTNDDGTYVFNNLLPGLYRLTQPNQPEGLLNGSTISGSAGGLATATTVTPSAIFNIDLSSILVSEENNFAEWSNPAEDTRTISGRVYHDRNVNDSYDEDDTGLGGQPVLLSGTDINGNPVNASVLTNSDGTYTFVDLPPGVYQITQPDQPEGLLNGTTIPGTAGGQATTPEVTPSAISGVDLRVALASENNDFLEWTVPSLSGRVWRDSNHDDVYDPGEISIPDWTVELWRDGVKISEMITDADGGYEFSNLMPGTGYEVRFRHPDSGSYFGRPVPNESGTGYTVGVVSPGNPVGADNTTGSLSNMTIPGGRDVYEHSLPLDPAGVVYDAVSRLPVPGATVTISGPAGFTTDDVLGGSTVQVTASDGLYQFLLLGTAPAGTYTLTVTPPEGYLSTPSQLIEACNNALEVGAFPDPALVQNSNQAPVESSSLHDSRTCATNTANLMTGAETTQYYTSFEFNGSSADIVNNHIPVDPLLSGAISMTKTTPKVSVTRGEIVPYVLTATNTLTVDFSNIVLEDQIPSGFQYVSGSARIDDAPFEPVVQGQLLKWPGQSLTGGQVVTVKLLLVVGSGVGFNDYVNQAWATNVLASTRVSNVATATVRVVPDPTFDCSDIVGTVYDDENRNGYQDSGESGLPGVRLATPRGWLVTTDKFGRYHVACADVPSELRGANFIIKVDERTLPSGYRITTENPRVVRITQGRMTKANFGASIHRVIRLDLGSDAFNSDNELNSNYQTRMQEVLDLLHAEPSILRIAYRMPVDSPVDQARERIGYIRDWITERWEPDGCCYDLQLEEEIVPATDSVEVIR